MALNTLAFDRELDEIERLLRRCSEAGVDAVIVQDVGVMALAREVAPELPIHASTQQSISSADGAEFARERALPRVVVGRELSTQEIASVARGTSAEVEAFVHGALCISWSGQCLSSEAWGGRSANRGQCAQACRLPYAVVVDGQEEGLQYALSPGDLCGLDDVPELIQAGVSCFKIEGRLKDERYVAATTRAYREAIDAVWDSTDENTVTRNDLRQVFARGQDSERDGLTPGFLRGPKHQSLVVGNAPRHRGVLAGSRCGGLPQEVWIGVGRGALRGHGVETCVEIKRRACRPNSRIDFHTGSSGATASSSTAGRTTRRTKWVVRCTTSTTFNQMVCKIDLRQRRTTKPWLSEGALLWRTSDALVDAKLKRLASSATVKRTSVGRGRLGTRRSADRDN